MIINQKITMRLHEERFLKIKNNTKFVELRVYDEKRRHIAIWDSIEFRSRTTGEIIIKKVTGLTVMKLFSELVNHYGSSAGWIESHEADKYYAKRYDEISIERYWVVGIELE